MIIATLSPLRISLLAFLLCVLVGTSLRAQSAQVPGDENWADLFGLGNLDGDIFAMTPLGTSLYVGGSFTHSGQQPLSHVARWDGTSWAVMGTDAVQGVDGIVNAIAVDGNDVYVAGKFSNAGGVPAKNIARYDATTNTWSALGAGVDGDGSAYVGSLAAFNGKVYVGGWFSTAGGAAVSNIAVWTKGTSSWAAMGAGIDGDVLALGVKDSILYAGGSFMTAGGVPANNVARWGINSGTWTPIIVSGVNGLKGYVNAIGTGAKGVYFGGRFLHVATSIGNKPGGDSAVNIIRWTGSAWLAMTNLFDRGPGGDGRYIWGNIGTDAAVRTIAVVGDSVYIGGVFKSARPESMTSGVATSAFVARYEGTGPWANLSFSKLKEGTDGYVNAIAAVGQNIFVGGAFRYAGGQQLSRIARWNVPTSAWSNLRSGPNGSMVAVGLKGAEVYAAGLMASPDGKSGYYVARWSGKQWETVSPTVNGPIYGMAINGNDIYVAGYYSQAGSVSAVNIARYNVLAKTWNSLGGAGVGGIGITYAGAVAVKGANVYVGGDFTIADDIGAKSIARWDGTKWNAMGSGVNGSVKVITVADNGDVYVGGLFSSAGGVPANNIARWDGTKWNAVGAGVNDVVRAIAISGTTVYVGGDFTKADNEVSRGIAYWDGAKWNGMAGGVSQGLFPFVHTISLSGSSVYIGGMFEKAGGVSINHIARWDGTKWNPLGNGTDGQVRASVINGSNLYVCGDFDEAGSHQSFKFGQWTAVPGKADPVDNGGGSIISRSGDIDFDHIGPNPVRDRAAIYYRVEASPSEIVTTGEPMQDVTLSIHDALGRTVAVLVDRAIASGDYRIDWDASEQPEGVYYCRLRSGDRVVTRVVVVRK